MTTAASATVFPGGNLDKADEEAAKHAIKSSGHQIDTKTLALKFCALRETFEECGILLTSPALPEDVDHQNLASWRKDVREDKMASA